MSHYKGAYQRQINRHYVTQYDSLNRYVLRLLEGSDGVRWPDVDLQAVPRFWAGDRECPIAELDSRSWHQEVTTSSRAERLSCWDGGYRDAHVGDVGWCKATCGLIHQQTQLESYSLSDAEPMQIVTQQRSNVIICHRIWLERHSSGRVAACLIAADCRPRVDCCSSRFVRRWNCSPSLLLHSVSRLVDSFWCSAAVRSTGRPVGWRGGS